MQEAVWQHLRCPICQRGFTDAGSGLRCAGGHGFDRARQGYVNLLTGVAPRATEPPHMVDARAGLLSSGLFDVLVDAVAAAAATRGGAWPHPPGLVVDAGGGTGHYLAAVLDRLPDHRGVTLDLSRAAARRAARAHERAAAAVCDVWRRLPVADAAADLVLNVFAPRNGAEFRRILRRTGTLLVVTPDPDHLVELVTRLGLVTVDPDKDRRLGYALDAHFALEERVPLTRRLLVGHDDVTRLVAMGPSAWHLDEPELAERVRPLPDPLTVTVSATVHVYRPLDASPASGAART
jgi:23S rRNA (guanine745-N1)-methyltransferase